MPYSNIKSLGDVAVIYKCVFFKLILWTDILNTYCEIGVS